MHFWCYILRCADRTYYTGHTDNLELRIAQHQSGQIKGYTSLRRPVEVIWAQDFSTRAEALESEFRIKKWSRVKKEALAASDWDRLAFFAKAPGERAPSIVHKGVSTTLDTNGVGGQ